MGFEADRGEVVPVPVRPWVAYRLCDMQGRERAFPCAELAVVAAWLRGTLCELAREDPDHAFPGGSEQFVAGHAAGKESFPRFSYLPLPTLTPPHLADGAVRRVMVAEPAGGDGRHIRWADRHLRFRVIRDAAGAMQAILLPCHPEDPVVLPYVRRGCWWASVTPVVLPGRDDGKPRKREKLLWRAVEQAGLPAELLRAIRVVRRPRWKVSTRPRAHRRPAYLGSYPVHHVELEFREPVTGPLSLGGGRHLGLGILACLD